MATKKAPATVTEYEAGLGPIAQTDKLFRLMVDSVVDYALFMLDPQGNVATWNRGAGRIKVSVRRVPLDASGVTQQVSAYFLADTY